MNDAELNRLAELIAAELVERPSEPDRDTAREQWVPAPVRPEPPERSSEPAPWSGAAQTLGDVAPIRSPGASNYRDDPGPAAAAIRAAAAGQTRQLPPARHARTERTQRPVRQRIVGQTVTLGVSNHHVHLSEADALALFGPQGISSLRQLTQPGQFAAVESVDVWGPKGKVPGVRVVGPYRTQTQLEISRSDAHVLGIEAPTAVSGNLMESVGGVELVGTHGRVSLTHGVIVPARHLHMSPIDAARWGVVSGDLVSVRCGSGARETTWHGVVVRTGPSHATELHVDSDEARGAGVKGGVSVQIVGVITRRERRRLYTERDIIRAVQSAEAIAPGALLTPSARDKAKMLGLKLP